MQPLFIARWLGRCILGLYEPRVWFFHFLAHVRLDFQVSSFLFPQAIRDLANSLGQGAAQILKGGLGRPVTTWKLVLIWAQGTIRLPLKKEPFL